MTPDYPVCQDCGQRHPPLDNLTTDQAFALSLDLALTEASKVTKAEPGRFPELEEALEVANRIGKTMLAATAAQQPGKGPFPNTRQVPPSDDVAYGMYL